MERDHRCVGQRLDQLFQARLKSFSFGIFCFLRTQAHVTLLSLIAGNGSLKGPVPCVAGVKGYHMLGSTFSVSDYEVVIFDLEDDADAFHGLSSLCPDFSQRYHLSMKHIYALVVSPGFPMTTISSGAI